MGIIPTNTLITLLDSLASGKLIYDNAVGVVGTEASTTGKAAQNDETTLSAVADAQVQADLAPAFKLRGDNLNAPSLYLTLGGYGIWWALDRHVANSSTPGVINLDTYMNANNLRASLHVQQLGFPLSPAQIMPPAVDPMATFVVGTGYTHVADIDTTQYGRAWLAVVVTSSSGIASNAIQATVNGLQIDGVTPTSKTVTIAAASSFGATVNLGTMGTQADSYDSVTSVTVTGGTAGDAFKVVSRVERVISAVS